MTGKLYSYTGGDFRSTPVNIKELLSGETSFREEVYCEELYLKSIQFDIFVHELDKEGSVLTEKAGELIGRLFDIKRCYEDEFDPMEVFDSVDQYTYEIFDMGRKHHEGTMSENIFAIESLQILPEHRGKNVGTVVLHILTEVIEVQFNLKAGCLIVKPESRDDVEYYNSKSFWEKLGFKRLGDSNYWYFSLDMKMLVDGKNPAEKEESYPKLVAESATIYQFRSNSDNKEQ